MIAVLYGDVKLNGNLMEIWFCAGFVFMAIKKAMGQIMDYSLMVGRVSASF